MSSVVTPNLTGASNQDWCVAYTWSRHEKNVAQYLSRWNIDIFLPLYRATRNWNGRRAQVDLPLFPSYVFARISRNERLKVLQAPGVVHIVSFHGTPALLPPQEIDALRSAIQVRAAEPHPYLAVGTRVRIGAGPLCGLEGFINRHKGRTRVVVTVDSIMQSAAIELDSNDLDACEETPWKGLQRRAA